MDFSWKYLLNELSRQQLLQTTNRFRQTITIEKEDQINQKMLVITSSIH